MEHYYRRGRRHILFAGISLSACTLRFYCLAELATVVHVSNHYRLKDNLKVKTTLNLGKCFKG